MVVVLLAGCWTYRKVSPLATLPLVWTIVADMCGGGERERGGRSERCVREGVREEDEKVCAWSAVGNKDIEERARA